MRPWMEKWGGVLLIFFCALVILFSALYTRQDDLRRIAAQSAASGQDETLEDAAAARICAPVQADITQPFTGAYQTESGLWKMDPFVHYSVKKNDAVFSCLTGTVESVAQHSIILKNDTFRFRLCGDFQPLAETGDFVSAGQTVARISQTGELLLSLQISGQYIDPLSRITP